MFFLNPQAFSMFSSVFFLSLSLSLSAKVKIYHNRISVDWPWEKTCDMR